jgi:hypothetical protein
MDVYKFGAVICAVVVVVLLVSLTREQFENVGRPADLSDGAYRITNTSNIPLTSNILTKVMCKDFLIGTQQPQRQLDWQLKRVAQSVYIFYKKGEKECLYAHPSNSPRSYFFPSCDAKSLCGLETPDHQGELDGDSLRTYFMILQHPSGLYYIKNMKNDMYLQMTNKRLSFTKTPNQMCLFNFKKL